MEAAQFRRVCSPWDNEWWQWGWGRRRSLPQVKSHICSWHRGLLYLMCDGLALGDSGCPPGSPWEPSLWKGSVGAGQGWQSQTLSPATLPHQPSPWARAPGAGSRPLSLSWALHRAPCFLQPGISATWDGERGPCCLRPRKQSSCFPS